MKLSVKRKAETGLFVSLIVLIVVAVMNITVSWTACAWYGYQTQRDTRYAFGVGCMVKAKNHWVPRGELRTEQ